VLAAVGILTDGIKRLLALELCGGESADAWQSFVDGLLARGLRAPLLHHRRQPSAAARGDAWLAQGGGATLRGAQAPQPAGQGAGARAGGSDHRLLPHRLCRERSRGARGLARFARRWAKRCPGVVRSLQEGGAELLTVFDFPREQWKTLRTTNVIERLNEEFRRRVKTQGSLPGEDAALLLLYSLVATGQITLRKLDGHEKIATVIRARVTSAA
jgi:putative transposase